MIDMWGFVIECFEDGEFLNDECVESNQRLLNESDLNTICIGKDMPLLFVRRQTDICNGYFINDDNRWDYGTRDDAINAIKRRI